ncbi:ABC transporter ATP-binding protein [Immundisolibacter sp.]|uniref:ABC transporter ATP-binding protein n=1 Tax=Immundisolibacter sp. TaxID=1934948 RepID=UPI00356526C6
MTPILDVQDLIKEYPGVRAVAGVSFSVPAGICFGLLGPNGAGKTTTVEMLEGICRPTAGRVLYRGEVQGAQFRAEAGIQFQSTALQDFLTVRETLVLFHRLYPRRADLEALIDLCQLRDLLERDNRKLSGGQRQRLLLAIALVNDPDIVFLDEPTTGLDPQARRNFWKLVQDIKAQGKTILLTTHYMEEAYVLCDEIAIMDRGRIIAQGSPDALLKAHFEDVVLTLPKADFDPPAEFAHALLDAGELWELSTREVPVALTALEGAGAGLQRLRIRERTLEDLFLELTGRELRA